MPNKPTDKERVCEKNCPDYKGMEILHKEQCDCSCHLLPNKPTTDKEIECPHDPVYYNGVWSRCCRICKPELFANKPTTLREEAEVAFFLFLDKHRDGYSHLDICNFFSDFWLKRLTSHNTETIGEDTTPEAVMKNKKLAKDIIKEMT